MTKPPRRPDAPRKNPSTERVAVQLPPERASAGWLRSIRFSGFTIAALSLIVLFVVVLAPSLKILVEQHQQIAALQASVKDQNAAVKNLQSERARWNDPSYVETLARERLNYVYPGEYSYLVINDSKAPVTRNGQPISDKLQTTSVDWVRTMLSSVLTAGLTDAPANKIVAPVLTGKKQ